MPVIFQPSTSSTVVLGADTALFLAEDAAITTNNADGISSSSSNLQLYLDGDVIALWTPNGGGNGSAIDLEGDNVELFIGANASILASGDDAAGFPDTDTLELGGLSHVTNHGTVASTENVVTLGSGADGSSFINHGTINAVGANGDAFQLVGADNVEIVNLGTITGGAISLISADDLTVVNHGLIDTSTKGTAISLIGSGSGLTVSNHGIIRGASTAVSGSSGADEVANHGEMNAVSMGSGNDTVINTGLVDGDVTLGDDADTFDGRGGTVTGLVRGGLGDDTYIVDDATLSLIELTGEGTDEVRAATDWTLGDHFETLTLIGGGDFDGVGNDLGNALTGNSGDNRLEGEGGLDTIAGGAGNDILLGGGGRDDIMGSTGDDTLRGQVGADTLSGGDGDDVVSGNAGDDVLSGDAGADTLIGGAGGDELTGGGQSDVFLFRNASESANDAGWDTITDFTRGEDVIDLSRLVQGGIDFLGTGAFTGTGQAEMRVLTTGGGAGSRLRIDLDGDGTSDMRIDLDGVTGLTALDFLL